MRKQMMLSFLAGVVIPLAMAAFLQEKNHPAPKAAETALTQPAAEPVMLTVLDRAGENRTMALEEYLVGVVLAEMPADFEEEALKAQAVVARTYTRKRMERDKHGAAALCMDSGCCQGWRSPEEYGEKTVEKVRRAVSGTAGTVLRYGDELIDATYFSCSGGSTEDAVAVWGQDVPYLRAVDSPGEEAAPRYSDTVTFTAAEFAKKLGLTNSGDPKGWFGAVAYTEGGGVATMVIRGETFTGTALRSKLGLRSTAFTVAVSGGTITITTRGFGHRVGMSQYGAQAMAKEGCTFEEILLHYYTGTRLVQEDMYADFQ